MRKHAGSTKFWNSVYILTFATTKDAITLLAPRELDVDANLKPNKKSTFWIHL